MKVGIVGAGADKFAEVGRSKCIQLITEFLVNRLPDVVLVSGHSPMGGVDIWSEDIAKRFDITMDLKIPKQNTWDAEYGYKQRNIDIAKSSDVLYVIIVDKYPEDYKGMRFKECYHCHTDDHVKSGGCWTGKVAMKLGKEVYWVKIRN